MSIKELCIQAALLRQQEEAEKKKVVGREWRDRVETRIREILSTPRPDGTHMLYTGQIQSIEPEPNIWHHGVEDIRFVSWNPNEYKSTDDPVVLQVLKTCPKCGHDYKSEVVNCRADVGQALLGDHNEIVCTALRISTVL